MVYGATIVRAMATGRPAAVYGNVANRGLIPDLLDGCCVEVPCLVGGNGVQPMVVGTLPPPCAVVNRTNVNVQELAALEDVARVYQAVMLDPLAGARLTLRQIWALVDELRPAEAAWMPAFASRYNMGDPQATPTVDTGRTAAPVHRPLSGSCSRRFQVLGRHPEGRGITGRACPLRTGS